MSGAEGVAGLALSAVSVAALFTSCIDCFNIVVAAKDFGRDYELLCTAISIQKLRLFLWGESVGLASRQGVLGPHHPGLDDPLINPIILRTLQSLNHLLAEARNIDSRYAPQDSRPVLTRRTRALDLFRNSFEEFQEAVQQNQKQKSVGTVTRWAIHDADKFEGIVKRSRGFIDGLQDITKALGTWPDQQARLEEEIESVADVESLRLIRDAAGQQDISHVASRQLQHFGAPLGAGGTKECELDAETPTALLTLDFVVAQHNRAFSNALSLTFTPRGQSLLDLVVPAERKKILTLLSFLRDELQEVSESSLVLNARNSSAPTLESLDLEYATSGFRTRSEHWKFRLPRDQDICFPILISLARDSTYFVVLNLVEPIIRHPCASNQTSILPPVDNFSVLMDKEPSPMPPKAHSRNTEFEWSTPESFARWFPSNETLFVQHDDKLTSGKMCLNVLTATDQGFGPLLQLFYLQMYDLKKRSFSLRRYSRDSGLEVCHTSRIYKKATGARPRIRRSINSSITSMRNFSRGSSRSSQTSAQSSQSEHEYSNYSSESAVNEDENEAQVKTSFQQTVGDTLFEQSSNQISLEFSNYANILLSRKAFGARKSYDFEYWGTAYQWKRQKKSQSLGKNRSYNLYRGQSDLVVAHITLQDLSWSQTDEEEEMGGWVPPIWMRITDPSILSENNSTDIPDVIIATGIIAFVDDCIRRRWNIPATTTSPHNGNSDQKPAETTKASTTETEVLVRNQLAILRNRRAERARHNALQNMEHDTGAATNIDMDSRGNMGSFLFPEKLT